MALTLASLIVLSLTRCSEPSSTPPDKHPIRIVATTGMIADLVATIAGNHAQVHALIGPSVDPHLYRPTRTDAQRLLNADIIFTNGLMLEGRLTPALDNARSAGKPVHALGDLLDPASLIASDESAKAHDPHLWMDPLLWAQTINIIRDSLAAYDPESSDTYAANAITCAAQLASLHDYAQRVLATVPEPSRVLITAHDAFSYFGRRYGFEVMGIQGISTESEAGTHEIQRLVSVLVDRKIAAVFVESTVSERAVNALIAGAAARGHAVTIGGTLFSDAMGPADTYEGTYLGMIDHNVTTIARALGGQAPERGMQGKLAP